MIEIRQLDGCVKLVDTLTVLPTDPEHQNVIDPIYAAYLKLAAHEYAEDLKSLRAKSEVVHLSKKLASESPFMCGAQTELRQRIFAASENQIMSSEIRKTVDALVHAATASPLWHPRHLITGRTANKWPEAWSILARWDAWELQKPVRWESRLKQHYADLSRSVTSITHGKQALSKMCDFVAKITGLKKGDLSALQRLTYGPLPQRVITR